MGNNNQKPTINQNTPTPILTEEEKAEKCRILDREIKNLFDDFSAKKTTKIWIIDSNFD